MSVFAWDGSLAAADKRAINAGLVRTTTKIFRVGAEIASYVGSADVGEEMLAWYRNGATPETYPQSARDKDCPATLVVVEPGGAVKLFERGPHAVRLDSGQQFASGSGRDFALMAMRLGKSAKEAVELAAEFENGCGNGVDVLTHETPHIA